MPGQISLGEFYSLQVTVRATHFSVFCSSAVGTLWICQEFRIPVNKSPCALFSLIDWVFAWSLNLTHFKRIRGLNTAIKIICQVPWSCLCPEFLTAQILKTRIGIMTQHSVNSCHDDKMQVELCHQHISKTPHAQKVHWLDCSFPRGPWQKEYLLRKPSSWDSQQQHFLSNHKRWKSQGKRAWRSQSLKMDCLQVKLSKTQNSGLNYNTQTVASRSYIHPWTRLPWEFSSQVVTYFSIYQLICHWTELMSLPGILCHLEKCDWAKNRHFWRRLLRFLFSLFLPDSSL